MEEHLTGKQALKLAKAEGLVPLDTYVICSALDMPNLTPVLKDNMEQLFDTKEEAEAVVGEGEIVAQRRVMVPM